MSEEALTSFTVCDGYLSFASQALLMTSQSIVIIIILISNGQYYSV